MTARFETDAPGAEYEELVATAPLTGPYATTEAHLILYTSGTTGSAQGGDASGRPPRSCGSRSDGLPLLSGDDVGHRSRWITGPTLRDASALHDLSIPTFLLGGTVSILRAEGGRLEKMADLIDRHAG